MKLVEPALAILLDFGRYFLRAGFRFAIDTDVEQGGKHITLAMIMRFSSTCSKDAETISRNGLSLGAFVLQRIHKYCCWIAISLRGNFHHTRRAGDIDFGEVITNDVQTGQEQAVSF